MRSLLEPKIVHDTDGSTIIEYALVLSLLSLMFIGGMQVMANATAGALIYVRTELIDYGLRNGS